MTDPSAPTIRGVRTPLDYLFFLRPVLLPPVWTTALLGTVGVVDPGRMPAWRWLVFFLHLTCLAGGIYTLNQLCDIDSDRRNRKLLFLPEGIIPVRGAWIFTVALDLAALALSVVFGLWYPALTVVGISMGIAYSVGRHAWKNHPWAGLLANAVGHGSLIFLFGRAAVGEPPIISWQASVPYLFAVGAVYLATTVPDRDGDRFSGKLTAAVALGAHRTMNLASLLVGAATMMAWVLEDDHLFGAALVALPFFIWSAARRGELATGAAKAAVAALSMAAVVAYPYYLILLVAGFCLTRLFFRWRFGMTYPTLHAGN
ncbi:MAG: UbiA family prenyltransferase [Candidatus Zixiibacteriota bacterium]